MAERGPARSWRVEQGVVDVGFAFRGNDDAEGAPDRAVKALADAVLRAMSAKFTDRTGCQSSALVTTYKRMAHTFGELGHRVGPEFEARIGFEPTCDGFANRCLTAWLPRREQSTLLGRRIVPLGVQPSTAIAFARPALRHMFVGW
jgi:hypothetical protein